jgi:hypothetical protein
MLLSGRQDCWESRVSRIACKLVCIWTQVPARVVHMSVASTVACACTYRLLLPMCVCL